MITNSPGVYSLVILLHRKTTFRVGALGPQTLPQGHYVYTGSALGPGGLRARIRHHINKKKSRGRDLWHIDFLLAHENAALTAIVAARTREKLECEVNQFVKERERAKIPVMGFGASDCKKNCGSHLLYPSEGNIDKKIATLYAEKLGFGKPQLTKIGQRSKQTYFLKIYFLKEISFSHVNLENHLNLKLTEIEIEL